MKIYDFYGILAILFWSSGIAFSRSISQKIGVVHSHFIAFFISGVLGLLWLFIRGRLKGSFRNKDLGKGLLVGGFFVLNLVCMYVAVGLVKNHQQVIVVSIINYSWPAVTILLSVPILGNRAKLALTLGIALAMFGVAMSILSSGNTATGGFLKEIDILPCLVSFFAALFWALYSNFARKWRSVISDNCVPIYMIVVSLLFLGFFPFAKEPFVLDYRCVIEIVYMAVVPLLLAYLFWDVGIKKGNSIFLVSSSFMIPIFSIIFSSIYLSCKLSSNMIIGCLMVLFGAFVCKLSVVEK